MADVRIKKVSAVEQVFQLMKEAIENHVWQEGEKIPSESELAEMYGVNRLTVRLALQQFNMLGVLETRVGEGTFLKEFNILNYLDKASDFWKCVDLMDDVQEFRTAIEIPSLRLAINRATAEEVAYLKEKYCAFLDIRDALAKGCTCDMQDAAQLAGADYDFHYALCEISHNELLAISYKMAKEPILEFMRMQICRRFSLDKMQLGKDVHDEWHKVILDAMDAKDFARAEKYMTYMLNYKSKDDGSEDI